MRAIKLKQVIPKKFCLACDVCCRFIDPNSIFTPYLTRTDADLLLEAGLPRKAINGNRFNLSPCGPINHCPCFSPDENKCSFYSFRPLECELYPFLLAKKNNEVYLALDKKCPFVGENFIKEMSKHIDYLKEILGSKEVAGLVKGAQNFPADYSRDKMIVYIDKIVIET